MKLLEGMTVLDLTRAIAGPYATLFLGDLGAKVIKIENPQDPDFIRDYTPYVGEEGNQFSASFAQYNRNKLGITLNLRKPEAQEIFKELVKKADVVVENYRPGVMEKFGLDYESLRKINPKIVYAAISGYGQDGPYKKRPAFDGNSQALSGLWSLNGYPEHTPVKVGTIISDLVGGLFGTIGIIGAYHYAQKTGTGQMVDVAQLDASLAITGYAIPKYTAGGIISGGSGNEDAIASPFELFKSKDGNIFFGGFKDNFIQVICEFFGEPDFLKENGLENMLDRFDQDNYKNIIKPKLDEWFSRYTSAELEDALADITPLSPIKNIAQAVVDPQIQAREMMVKNMYPEGLIETFGLPIKLSETPGDTSGLAPKLGQHNKEIYGKLLAMDEKQMKLLSEKGVI